jgi:Na+/H+ antiporter
MGTPRAEDDMTAVTQFELILLLIGAVVILDVAARRLHLPHAMALILGGIGLALIPGAPDFEMNPELVLVLFLPPLLMSSALIMSWRDFRADIRIIWRLAVLGVVFTTLVVGVVAHLLLPSLPWAACFALGAIVSPPDAVAAKSALAKLPLPPRVVLLLESESLVNDASGLVLLRFAVMAMLTGTFSFWQATASFAWLAVGGVAVGCAFAWLTISIVRRIHESDLIIIWSLLAAWMSYIMAEKLGVSGVLSTVACGLVLGWHQHEILKAGTRTRAIAVWGLTVFVLESLVFILIGLSLRGVVMRLEAVTSISALAYPVTIIVVAVIVARFIWIFGGLYIPRLVRALRRKSDTHYYPPVGSAFIMSWAGLRGVVSLAAALSLPSDFPGRDFILVTTFAVILVTVMVQGATLAPIARLFFKGAPSKMQNSRLSEDHARARVAEAQLAAILRESELPDGQQKHPKLLDQYSYRAKATARFAEERDVLISYREEHFSAVLSAVSAGRAELLRLHRSGEIQDSVLHAIEAELDLEEVWILRFVTPGSAG